MALGIRMAAIAPCCVVPGEVCSTVTTFRERMLGRKSRRIAPGRTRWRTRNGPLMQSPRFLRLLRRRIGVREVLTVERNTGTICI